MRNPGEDDRLEELGKAIESEKRAALAAFDSEAFARRVRHAVAAASGKAADRPALSPWVLRLGLAGAVAALLLVAVLATRPPAHPRLDARTASRALERCAYFAGGPATAHVGAAGAAPGEERGSDLEWQLRALVYRAQRACASCPAGEEVLRKGLIVAMGAPLPDERSLEWRPVSSARLAERLSALSRAGTLARALARTK